MRRHPPRHPRRVAAALALAALPSLPSPALASNHEGAFAGDAAALSGGAVTASVPGAEAAWVNPAALAGVPAGRFDVSGTLGRVSLVRIDDALAIDGGPGQRRAADVRSSDVSALANAVAYARRLDGGITLGLGLFTPESFEVDETLQLRATVRDAQGQTFDVNETATARAIRESFAAGGAVAAAISDGVDLGAGVFGVYRREESEQTVLIDQLVTPGGAEASILAIGRNRVEGVGLLAVLGMRVQAGDITLGFTARSPQILVWRRNQESVEASGGAPGAIVSTSTLRQHVQLVPAAPGRLVAAAALRMGDAQYSIEGELIPPIAASRIGLDTDLSWNVRVGARWRVDPSWTVGAGLFTDRSADRSVDDVTGLRIDYFGGTLGVERLFSLRLAPGESTSSGDALTLRTVIAIRYAFGAGVGEVSEYTPSTASLRTKRADVTAHEISFYVGGGLSF